MRFHWSAARHSPIAVDFGAAQLKVLQVTTDPTPQLIAAGAVDVPADLHHNDAALQAFYKDGLKKLLTEQSFRGRRAVCAIGGGQTLIQHLQLPLDETANPAALRQQVDEQLRDRLNIDPQRMVIRCFPGDVIERSGEPKQEAIAIAAPRQSVMRRIAIAQQAGLDMADMRCHPQTVLRAFAHLYRRASDADVTTCFLDLGAQTTHIIIAHGREMVAAKSVHAAFQKTVSDTIFQKKVSDIVSREAAPGMTAISTEAPAAVHDETADYLVDELQLCLRYYHGMYPGRAVDKLVFIGGAAADHARCQYVAQRTGIAAQLGDPLARLSRANLTGSPPGIDMRKPQPGWAVPMGLCLSQGA